MSFHKHNSLVCEGAKITEAILFLGITQGDIQSAAAGDGGSVLVLTAAHVSCSDIAPPVLSQKACGVRVTGIWVFFMENGL